MTESEVDVTGQPAAQAGKTGKRKAIALALVGLGLLLQLISFQLLSALDACEPSAPSRNISLALLLGGIGFALVGLAFYARAKGATLLSAYWHSSLSSVRFSRSSR